MKAADLSIAAEKEFQRRCDDVLGVARGLHSQNPHWLTFFREVFGIAGIVRQTFAEATDVNAFEKTPAHAELLRMLGDLKTRRTGRDEGGEPTTVITVRLPKSLHDALRVTAQEQRTSINRLCIQRLIGLEEAAEAVDPSAEAED